MSDLVMDGPPTQTSRVQEKTEADVATAFTKFLMESGGPDSPDIRLQRDQHRDLLHGGLRSLPTGFAGLDASRPWFCFWISHALEVMGMFDEEILPPALASFLNKCQSPTGGFAGGPGQLAHLAPTYAAVAALVIAGSEVAYKIVDRPALYDFLMRLKSPDGGFTMHEQGETDMRGTYCAISVASMLHMLTDELTQGVPEYVRRCQTYEGGIAGEEGLEAHGGYSYCGLAAVSIIGKADALDLHGFLHWAVHRQMNIEGGFQGRTNKLVDSCYTFWQGATFPLLHEAFRQQGKEKELLLPTDIPWFAPSPLQSYVFLACQHPGGGLRDKPGKSADYYHTCYALSGMAASQYGLDGRQRVVGEAEANLLGRIDVYYNVLLEKSQRKCKFFEDIPTFQYKGREISGQEGEGVRLARAQTLGLQPLSGLP